MSYAGSEAVSLAYAEGSQAYQRASLRPALEVVNGAGLDARVRQGVSDDFLVRARLAVIAVVTVVILGACRVGICAATLTTLQSTSSLRAQIKAAQVLETDLKVTRSVLADTSRIDRIATQNYGMVKVADYEEISIPLVAAPAPVEQEEAVSEQGEAASPEALEGTMEFLFGPAEDAEPEGEPERIYTTMAMPASGDADVDDTAKAGATTDEAEVADPNAAADDASAQA